MKKFAIASLIALAVTAASAMEVGVVASRDLSSDRNAAGLTLGQKFGAVGVTAGFERSTVGSVSQTRVGTTVGLDVATLGPVTIAPTLGVAYLDNATGADGAALTLGVSATVPVTSQVNLSVNLGRQYGQQRVQAHDGNRVTVGLNYRF